MWCKYLAIRIIKYECWRKITALRNLMLCWELRLRPQYYIVRPCLRLVALIPTFFSSRLISSFDFILVSASSSHFTLFVPMREVTCEGSTHLMHTIPVPFSLYQKVPYISVFLDHTQLFSKDCFKSVMW